MKSNFYHYIVPKNDSKVNDKKQDFLPCRFGKNGILLIKNRNPKFPCSALHIDI